MSGGRLRWALHGVRGATLLVLLAGPMPGAAETEVGAAPPTRAPVEDAVPEGPSVEARLAAIRARVQAAARYPESARLRGLSGEAEVTFDITPEGRPANVRIARSSGSGTLDDAAARAVHAAGALPRVLGPVRVPVRFALVAADRSGPRGPALVESR